MTVKQTKQYINRRGFVALVTILIVTAISLILGTSIIMKSITQSTLSVAEGQASQAWASANACAEYALSRLAENGTTTWDLVDPAGYKGNETLPNGIITDIGNDPLGDPVSCSILPITAGANESRIINATSTVGEFTRKIQVIAATNTPSIVITSWGEVGDF